MCPDGDGIAACRHLSASVTQTLFEVAIQMSLAKAEHTDLVFFCPAYELGEIIPIEAHRARCPCRLLVQEKLSQSLLPVQSAAVSPCGAVVSLLLVESCSHMTHTLLLAHFIISKTYFFATG